MLGTSLDIVGPARNIFAGVLGGGGVVLVVNAGGKGMLLRMKRYFANPIAQYVFCTRNST